MVRTEAKALAESHLEPYRRRSFAELLPLLTTWVPFEGTTSDGVGYSGKIYATWAGHPHHHLRVRSDVSSGGWSDFHPTTVTFNIAPDGTCVEE